MKQALHIFKKDVRYLRWELGLLLVCTTLFMFEKTDLDEGVLVAPLLLAFAWAFVCARLIQAETIPGDRQFWITRPYEWRSLLAAKLLFVAIFVSIPLLIADAVILAREGFSIAAHMPGLLCSVMLITCSGVLAMCAFASITRGLTQWILSAIAITACIGGVNSLAAWRRWGSVEWIRDLGYGAILFITASLVLLWQYHHRRTMASRIVMAAGLVAASVYFLFTPPAKAWEFETHFLKPKVDPSAIRLTIHPASEHITPQRQGMGRLPDRIPLAVPIDVSGLDRGKDVIGGATGLTIELPDGETRSASQNVANYLEHRPHGYALIVHLDRKVFEEAMAKPVRLRITIDLTLLGNPVSKVIQGSDPVPVPGVGLCMMVTPRDLVPLVACKTALRNASNMLVMNMGEDGRNGFFVDTSDSPLPGSLNLMPIRWFTHGAYNFREDTHFSPPVLVSLEPLAHFRREIEAHDLYLLDYKIGAR